MLDKPSAPCVTRTAAEVIDIAQKWVDEHRDNVEHFAGAYLFGGIVHLPADACFPGYRDVDLIILQSADSTEPTENLEVLYDGLMIEVGFECLQNIESADKILANPSLAANIAFTHILADPLGILAPLKREVHANYARQQWVQSRVDREMQEVHTSIDGMARGESMFEKSQALWSTCSNLSGLVALACLKPPTHRRSLALSREIFNLHQRDDLQEQMLELWGSHALSPAAVQELLKEAIELFDRALRLHKTPVPLDFKLHAHLRPYYLEATQEMIDEGCHLEATFWIALPNSLGFMVAMADGSEADQAWAAERYARFLATHGWDGANAFEKRVIQARRLSDLFGSFAAERIAEYA